MSAAIRSILIASLLALAALLPAASGGNVFAVSGQQVLLNQQPFKVIGLRCSNALLSDATADELIANLPLFRGYGVNTVSVFLMGSRFGDIAGYRPDASLDPIYAARLDRIIEAADQQGMVVLVGCLYWGTSTANDALGAWRQAEANTAVANTVRFLVQHGHRNVFVDPDNEGMANATKGWSIGQMIAAGKAVDPSIMIGYNDTATPPSNADLLLHFSPRDGVRPYIESEGSAGSIPNPPGGGYWGTYSKETYQNDRSYWNYSRIGRYTTSMKDSQIDDAIRNIDHQAGYLMASTWLQCADDQGIGGPFMRPGGRSLISDVNQSIDSLHPDAGVLWWLEAMQARYGAWTAPGTADPEPEPPSTSPSPGISAVYLIDAATDTRIASLGEFTTIDLATVGSALSIEAVANAATESVRFDLNQGSHVQIENTPPYALNGDSNGDFTAYAFTPGSYVLNLTPFSANRAGGNAGPTVSVAFSVIDSGTSSPGFSVAINFQPANAPIPADHLVDSGQAFGARGNGASYGWDQDTFHTRDRNLIADQRYDTLNHLQKNGDRRWELALDPGLYRVTVTCSDPGYVDQANHLLIEGVSVRDPDPLSDGFDQAAVEVTVEDGRLTIGPERDAQNAKLSTVVVESLPASSN